jgi:hypothetical protein
LLTFDKFVRLLNVEQRLELDDELPLIVADILSVELLEGVNALSGDQTVQSLLFFKVTTIHGLVTAHLDLDSD